MAAPTDQPPPQGIALFDLDGTLLAWDCQLLFRDFVVRRERWRRMLVIPFLLLAPFTAVLGKDRMKRVFLAFLWRMPDERLACHASGFADSVLPLVFPELRALLESHRKAGDLLVLASASPEPYVREIGARLGFDISLGTVIRHGPLFPPLQNHKGVAKVERLRDILPADRFHEGVLARSHGYTDSAADLPMLGLCECATVVNPKPALAALARAKGWRIIRPARPWSGRLDHALRSIFLLFGIGRDPAGRGITR